MRQTSRFLLLIAGLWPLSVAADPLLSAEGTDSVTQESQESQESQEEIIQHILELKRQIEDLLEILPDEVREEVERRWQERPAAAESGEATLAERELEQEAAPVGQTAPEAMPIAAEEIPILEEVVTQPQLPPCGGFHLFDSNEDLLVSGGDRQWRFLRLWFDDNGDGAIEESEIKSLFELGVRQIDVGLEFYINDEGDSEDVDVDDLIWLRMVGKGSGNQRSGALAVAADRLVRDGHFWPTDSTGDKLAGFQPLDPAGHLETREGESYPVFCQDPE